MTTQIRENKKLISIITFVLLLVCADIVEAQYGGMHRRTRRRTAVVVASATHAKDQEAQQQQQQAEQQDTTAAQPKAASSDHLPYGTVVTELPEDCEAQAVSDVQYYLCGSDYYRVAYQGNNLVYVTTEPPK